ncbi:MAG: MoaD/ThiS family protein [Bacillota bacterium]|nr:MoaD/ThiS family protein [Bacillota bacterium]
MKSYLRFYGHLRKYNHNLEEHCQSIYILDINETTTVKDLYFILGIKETEVMIVDINGELVHQEATIKPESLVSFFPFVDGG